MTSHLQIAALSCLALLAGAPARAGDLVLTALDGRAVAVTPAAFAALPHVTASLNIHGKLIVFRGVKLQNLLAPVALPVGEAIRGPALAEAVLVEAADGYRVALTVADLDAAFQGPLVILADEADGKPLDAAEGPFRLVVANDGRPARSAKQVVSIRIVAVR